MAASIISGGLTQPSPAYLSSLNLNGPGPHVVSAGALNFQANTATGTAISLSAPNDLSPGAISLSAGGATGGIALSALGGLVDISANAFVVHSSGTTFNAVLIESTVSGDPSAVNIAALNGGGITLSTDLAVTVDGHGVVTGPTAGYLLTAMTAIVPSATLTAVCNAKSGHVQFTNVNLLNGSAQTFTITNSHAGSDGIVTFAYPAAGGTAACFVRSAVWTAGTNLVVNIANGGAGDATSVQMDIWFQSWT